MHEINKYAKIVFSINFTINNKLQIMQIITLKLGDFCSIKYATCFSFVIT